jgi:hypothetical protein
MKTKKTWVLEWGWCGLGYVGRGQQGNLFPAICLGVVRFSWCRGSLMDELASLMGKKK